MRGTQNHLNYLDISFQSEVMIFVALPLADFQLIGHIYRAHGNFFSLVKYFMASNIIVGKGLLRLF